MAPSDFAYIAAIVRSRQVAAGVLVGRLERQFARITGTRYAAATSSGTTALHLGLLALGIGPGDEVAAPSYTCAAVVHAIEHTGASARLLDVDGDTLNVTAATVRRRLTRRTKAIVVTHSFGFPAPMDELVNLGVPIVEDCALALGARYHGRPVGSLGVLAVGSLYATKVVCAGEGGMVYTNDAALIRRVRDLNALDQRTAWRPRYNYKLSDLAAGLGLSQIQRLPRLLARRRAIAARYAKSFGAVGAVAQEPIVGARPNYYRFLLRTPRATHVIDVARRRGVQCDRPVFRPLHRYFGGDASAFPGTEWAAHSVVSVPIYPSLAPAEVDQVIRRLGPVVGR